MMKVLFIHGLASSGAYKTASTLHNVLRPCEVIAPDVPIEPQEAYSRLMAICNDEKPDLVVGLSLGGFWAQKLRGFTKILINPELHPSRLLRLLQGEMKYLSPRKDGAESFVITREIADGYMDFETCQFEGLTQEEISVTTGMFADHDRLVRCKDIFEKWYPGRAVSYPGEHLPTFPEIKKYLVPLVDRK